MLAGRTLIKLCFGKVIFYKGVEAADQQSFIKDQKSNELVTKSTYCSSVCLQFFARCFQIRINRDNACGTIPSAKSIFTRVFCKAKFSTCYSPVLNFDSGNGWERELELSRNIFPLNFRHFHPPKRIKPRREFQPDKKPETFYRIKSINQPPPSYY